MEFTRLSFLRAKIDRFYINNLIRIPNNILRSDS